MQNVDETQERIRNDNNNSNNNNHNKCSNNKCNNNNSNINSGNNMVHGELEDHLSILFISLINFARFTSTFTFLLWNNWTNLYMLGFLT